MTKKYDNIFLIVLGVCLFVVTITQIVTAKTIDQVESDIDNIFNYDEYNEENQEEEDLIAIFNFDEDININDIVEMEDKYLAYGSKGTFPFMQKIRSFSQRDLNISTDFSKINGEVVSVIDNEYFLTTDIQKDRKIVSQDFFVSKDQIIPFYKKQLTINYTAGVTINPEYFVIHETANTRAGADANAHWRYWSTNPDARASTHFLVDSEEIYQVLELDQMAWHVGDNRGYSDIKNNNSLGLEIAVNSDGNYEQARQHAIELTIQVMSSLDMDISQLVRHYDASGKNCPAIMLAQPDLWTDFVAQVERGLQTS